MITVLDWDMLTPAAFAMSNANDVDVGVGRSMLINNIRWGKEIDPIMKDLDPRFMPDWAKLKEEYDKNSPEENAGVSSELNVWHRKNHDNYKKLVELWNKDPRDCEGMVYLMKTSEDPGPISGPARQEWLENLGEIDPGFTVTPEEAEQAAQQ